MYHKIPFSRIGFIHLFVGEKKKKRIKRQRNERRKEQDHLLISQVRKVGKIRSLVSTKAKVLALTKGQ